MKKIKKIFVLLLMAFFLTGCVNVETNMDITLNKKMYFTIKMTLDKSLLEGDDIYKDELLDNKQKEKLINDGFEIQKYETDEYIGNIISKEFDNIDYLSSPDDINYDLASVIENPLSTAYIFKVEKHFLKNKYYAKYDLSNYAQDNIYSFDFKVTLPNKALKNNASSIEEDGKQLIWNIGYKNEPIEFEFELYNIINVVAVGLTGLIILLIITYLLFAIFGKKIKPKKKKVKKVKDPDVDEGYHPRFIMPEQNYNDDEDDD